MPEDQLPELDFGSVEEQKKPKAPEDQLPELDFGDPKSTEKKEEVPEWKSAITGGAKGIPFVGEWTDEMAAAAKAMKDITTTKRYTLSDFKELYEFWKPRITEADKKIMEANPKTALAAQLATSIITPAGGTGLVARAGLSAAEAGVSQLGRERDLEKAGKAATLGGAFSLAGELLRVPAYLAKSGAKKAAVKAVGITPTKLRKVEERYGKQIKDQIADTIREKKLLPGMTPDKALLKTEKLLDKTGKEIGDTLIGLQHADVPVDIADALNDIQHILLSKFDDPSQIADKLTKASYKKINEEILPEFYNAAKTGSWQDLANMRSYLVDKLKTKTDALPVSKTEYRDSLIALDSVISQKLKGVSPELAASYKALKTEYGALKTIEAGLKSSKGESVMGLLERGKALEAITKTAITPIAKQAQKAAIYHAPEFTEGLADIITRRATRPLLQKKMEKEPKK